MDPDLPPAPDLPNVRRLEAVGFRAWPAASSLYDGSWLIRLTAGHPSKRLNSVNPLDPSDYRDIEIRLEKARKRFADYGRPMLVRQTPLAPQQLIDHMDSRDWSRLGETIVMTCDLPAGDSGDALDYLPSHDVGRFVDARIHVAAEPPTLKPGLTEIVNAIKPETGFFVFEAKDRAATAVALAVQDNDLAGVLQLGVHEKARGQGLGASILHACLRWAQLRGARRAWVQVEAENTAAVALYRKSGFGEAYRYVYREASQP
ncbi:GNAT family N-acetyltransferase [Rhizobium sp. TRM95111]|uniref:GNAT family N-acetyltransferase n=1 Tax=Rhizobium alarense TaxID=2846851 RepID=UPI001F396126|nr:GNAT family N-acetyltransferase [Rhizobium alarense]MCF3642200.1 GNAT family N-acetyltransferase [Rhizobium alarense]